MPDTSVVIPTYNCERFIGIALESVINQTLAPQEVIVVDDGSTDGTEGVLRAYRDRITYIRMANSGGYPSVVRNAGIEAASGDYIAFLDADDVWHLSKLAEQIAIMECQQDVAMVYSDYDRVDENGCLIPDAPQTKPCAIENGKITATDDYWSDAFCQLSLRCFMQTSTVVVRKTVLDSVGRFDGSLLFHEDHDLWLRIAYAGRIERLPVVRASYRVRASSNTHTRREVLLRDTRAFYDKALKLVAPDRERSAFVRRAYRLVLASALVTTAYSPLELSPLRRSLLLCQALFYDPLMWRTEKHVWKSAVRYALKSIYRG